MAKLSAIIAALLANETTKALGMELQGEVGSMGDLSAKEIVDQSKKLTAEIFEMNGKIQKLDSAVKENDTIRATSAAFQLSNKKLIIERALAAQGKAHGFNPAAVKTALAVLNIDKITVDPEKLEVTSGLNQEFFEGLKKEHSIFFTAADASANAKSGALIPAMPPAGNGAPASQATPEIPGPVGGFIKAGKM